MRKKLVAVFAALVVVLGALPAAASGSEREVFFRAARENTVNNTVSLPLMTGRANGQAFRFVITETSDRDLSRRLGVNYAPKLANAAGTDAVQEGRLDRRGVLSTEGTIDFSPERVVVPGPDGFPPVTAEPGSVADAHYSPLVELPGGIVINAPHVANASGVHDKVVGSISTGSRRVTLQESEGFYEGAEVYYVSFDASASDIAALEGATFVPRLNAAPGLGSNEDDSARSGIAPVVNGETGADNPDRQGLQSALLGEGDPLNVVQTEADDNDYSPLWDVHATVWADPADRVLLTDFDEIVDLAEDGIVTGPSGTWEAIGVIVNCPLISIED